MGTGKQLKGRALLDGMCKDWRGVLIYFFEAVLPWNWDVTSSVNFTKHVYGKDGDTYMLKDSDGSGRWYLHWYAD